MSLYNSIVILLILIMYPFSAVAKDTVTPSQTLINAKKTIAYIYKGPADPCTDKISPIGTGFFAGFGNITKPDGSTINLLYLITNKHVIALCPTITVRLDDGVNKPECLNIDIHTNGANKNVLLAKADDVDLVAIALGACSTQPLGFDYSMLIDDKLLTGYEIQEGTDVVTLGFMLENPGFKRNYPTLRFGKIASLNTEKWFAGGTGKLEQAYVVDMNLTYGTSGSPVILNPEQIRVTENNDLQHRRIPMLLFGIVKGAPPTPAGALKDVPSLRVNLLQGVTAIEPASNLKILMHDLANELSTAGYKIKLDDSALPSPTNVIPH